MESAGVKQSFGRWAATGLAASTGLGLALGLIGPFGSYLNGSPAVRVAYWVVCLWAGWVAFGVSLPLLSAWARRRGTPAWLWTPPTVAVLAIVPATLSRILALSLWPIVGSVSWLEWYGQCLLISALITTGVLWWTRDRDAESGLNATSADPRYRLSAKLGRDVICLQMEDHYVRVHTSRGSELVLMSLSQAMAGLGDLEGVQTHRSWWVARSAIAGVIEDGRNLRLRLGGGLQVPVSRARIGKLREMGWLPPAGSLIGQ